MASISGSTSAPAGAIVQATTVEGLAPNADQAAAKKAASEKGDTRQASFKKDNATANEAQGDVKLDAKTKMAQGIAGVVSGDSIAATKDQLTAPDGGPAAGRAEGKDGSRGSENAVAIFSALKLGAKTDGPLAKANDTAFAADIALFTLPLSGEAVGNLKALGQAVDAAPSLEGALKGLQGTDAAKASASAKPTIGTEAQTLSVKLQQFAKFHQLAQVVDKTFYQQARGDLKALEQKLPPGLVSSLKPVMTDIAMLMKSVHPINNSDPSKPVLTTDVVHQMEKLIVPAYKQLAARIGTIAKGGKMEILRAAHKDLIAGKDISTYPKDVQQLLLDIVPPTQQHKGGANDSKTNYDFRSHPTSGAHKNSGQAKSPQAAGIPLEASGALTSGAVPLESGAAINSDGSTDSSASGAGGSSMLMGDGPVSIPSMVGGDIDAMVQWILMQCTNEEDAELTDQMHTMQNNLNQKKAERQKISQMEQAKTNIDDQLHKEFYAMQGAGQIGPDVKYEDYAAYRQINAGTGEITPTGELHYPSPVLSPLSSQMPLPDALALGPAALAAKPGAGSITPGTGEQYGLDDDTFNTLNMQFQVSAEAKEPGMNFNMWLSKNGIKPTTTLPGIENNLTKAQALLGSKAIATSATGNASPALQKEIADYTHYEMISKLTDAGADMGKMKEHLAAQLTKDAANLSPEDKANFQAWQTGTGPDGAPFVLAGPDKVPITNLPDTLAKLNTFASQLSGVIGAIKQACGDYNADTSGNSRGDYFIDSISFDKNGPVVQWHYDHKGGGTDRHTADCSGNGAFFIHGKDSSGVFGGIVGGVIGMAALGGPFGAAVGAGAGYLIGHDSTNRMTAGMPPIGDDPGMQALFSQASDDLAKAGVPGDGAGIDAKKFASSIADDVDQLSTGGSLDVPGFTPDDPTKGPQPPAQDVIDAATKAVGDRLAALKALDPPLDKLPHNTRGQVTDISSIDPTLAKTLIADGIIVMGTADPDSAAAMSAAEKIDQALGHYGTGDSQDPAMQYNQSISINQLGTMIDTEKGNLDSLGDLSEINQMRLQSMMDQRSKLIEMMSNIMKKASTTDDTLTQNLK